METKVGVGERDGETVSGHCLWDSGDWDGVDGAPGWEESEGKGGTQSRVPVRMKRVKEKMEEPRWGEARTLPKGHQENGREEGS